MSMPSSKQSDWTVSLPLSDLVALEALPGEMEKLKEDNAQLRREMDGLRLMFSEVMQQFGDVKRELKKR